jgi:hypothetical protein
LGKLVAKVRQHRTESEFACSSVGVPSSTLNSGVARRRLSCETPEALRRTAMVAVLAETRAITITTIPASAPLWKVRIGLVGHIDNVVGEERSRELAQAG